MEDQNLQGTLKQQLQRLSKDAAAAVTVTSPVETLRLADGAFRNASHLHEQAVASVLRLRASLKAAEEKETMAAYKLAEAREAKANAAQALAVAEGVHSLQPDSRDQ
eukprot:2086230-Pyramimonas_sp.AAC.1